MHEIHGRMHPNYYQITILLIVDLCSSLAYFMMTHSLPIACKLPIKTLVARQLPTNTHNNIILYIVHVTTRIHSHIHFHTQVCFGKPLVACVLPFQNLRVLSILLGVRFISLGGLRSNRRLSTCYFIANVP